MSSSLHLQTVQNSESETLPRDFFTVFGLLTIGKLLCPRIWYLSSFACIFHAQGWKIPWCHLSLPSAQAAPVPAVSLSFGPLTSLQLGDCRNISGSNGPDHSWSGSAGPCTGRPQRTFQPKQPCKLKEPPNGLITCASRQHWRENAFSRQDSDRFASLSCFLPSVHTLPQNLANNAHSGHQTWFPKKCQIL